VPQRAASLPDVDDPGAVSAANRPTDNAPGYHEQELAIALSDSDRRHVLPPLPERFDSILDLGCGAGQTLIASRLPPHVLACGVDVDLSALALGRTMTSGVQFVLASGERLPFADRSFDVIISRVALPYMHVPTTLREIARVLTPGGYLWIALHPLGVHLRRIVKSARGGNVRDVVYVSYVIVNGLWFAWTGHQFRFPFNRLRCESFQTAAGMTRALGTLGFHEIRVSTEPFFVMSATKGR